MLKVPGLEFAIFLTATVTISEDKITTNEMNQSARGCQDRGVSHVATCEEFVRRHGGKRVIHKILIANNGIAGEVQFILKM